MFPTTYTDIVKRIEAVDPISYGKTRNYIDGDVSYLSPYISRGVISTRQVMEITLERGFQTSDIQKFLQELAWRDYWQLIWLSKDEKIFEDLRHPQPQVQHHEVPSALINANTGIEAIDTAIEEFYQTGYLHNHVRMYIASIACNIGNSHWWAPSQWMYYHLLDGDLASNSLSWQWVAGSNSNKKYFANQENINKYCNTQQSGTFLDVPYEAFNDFDIPERLLSTVSFHKETPLPTSDTLALNTEAPTLLYTYYNLDPKWREDADANRILILEPSLFKQFPVSKSCIDFTLKLGENIPGLQVFVGEFDDFIASYSPNEIYYKEHPTNSHFEGHEDTRDWMFDVKGYYPSFFKYWNLAKKELKQLEA